MRTSERSRAIDILVQASTIELLRSYDIAAAPTAGTPLGAAAPNETALRSGSIEFSSKQLAGRLSLSITDSLAAATSSAQGGLRPANADWVSELANQLMGRIKNRLARFGVQLRTGLPLTSTGIGPASPPSLASGELLTYVFRTLKGDVLVTLAGKFDHEALCYANASQPTDAPDIILF